MRARTLFVFLLGLAGGCALLDELKSDDDTGSGPTAPSTGPTDTAPAICPGSEAFCAEAESHCDDTWQLQICQYMEDDDCIAHFEVDCAVEVGPGNTCLTVTETEAGCGPIPVCPGSEELCTVAESHCDEAWDMQICQHLEDDNCIAHFEVDCAEEVGHDFTCIDVSETEAACAPLPACPGSEGLCTASESHCDEDGQMQICTHMEEANCLQHDTVDCAEVVGPEYVCVQDEEDVAACAPG